MKVVQKRNKTPSSVEERRVTKGCIQVASHKVIKLDLLLDMCVVSKCACSFLIRLILEILQTSFNLCIFCASSNAASRFKSMIIT